MKTVDVRRRLAWRRARVAETIAETTTARTIVFDMDGSMGWDGHVAGQHVDLRLTADDGYQATRSYSLSGGPTEAPQITVELVDDGEVSPYLVEIIKEGDEIELRGPIGGYFVWEPSERSLLLVGGGSGIAPLRAMWRARENTTQITVLYSAQTDTRLMFADELASLAGVDVRIHLTREARPQYAAGRIGADALSRAIDPATDTDVYVCGPTAFVESVSGDVVDLGIDPRRVRTERFG